LSEPSKNRSIYGAFFFLALVLFGLAGCDNYNQSIEDFIYRQTGTVAPGDHPRVLSPPTEPESDGSFHIRSANTDIVLELGLQNDRGYDLRVRALNRDGTAAETVRAEQTAPDRIVLRIAGANPGDLFRLVLQLDSADGRRSFGEIQLPDLYCVRGARELLSFALGPWPGVINGAAKTVAVTVPYGAGISGIIPDVTVSEGADYSPKDAWGSGASGGARIYRVTAEDGTSVDYVVTVVLVYDIDITPSANGTVTASASGAAAGETVALTLTPDSGYGLKAGTLLVNETTSGLPVTPSDSGGSYSFVMPAAEITVTAEFVATGSHAARRGVTLYESLKAAIDAAPALSASSPGEITLLRSITLPEGVETAGYVINKHIRLASGGAGGNTITRNSGFTGSLFTVDSGASLTLDGSPNALVIDGSGINVTAAIIAVEGGTLNMYDGVTLKDNRNTTITTTLANQGGGVRVTGGGSFTMNGGTISGNAIGDNTNGNGGGVYVSGNGSRFEMQGGTIDGSGLTRNAANGGGVMVGNGASFVMTGGSITGNTATNGGAVYNSNATFTMTAGSITGNEAKGYGGAVYIIGASSLFEMQGGTIGGSGSAKNTAPASNGNGVYVGNFGVFAMSGTASLMGNGVHMSGSATSISIEGEAMVDPVNDQIYLESAYLIAGKFVTLSGNLTGTAPRARIQPAFFIPLLTKVLGGDGTLVHDNKAMFDLYDGSTSYPGATRIGDDGRINP
jgi:hypothetical protein